MQTEWCARANALGFIRTYAFLIQYPSDFKIALEEGLLPTTTTTSNINYDSFSSFIAQFYCIPDEEAAIRYHYGQLRLTRLNWAVRIVRPREANGAWNYQETYWQTGQYLQALFNPLMFCFASVATVLSAMQVLASIPHTSQVSDQSLETFQQVSFGFCILSVMLVLFVWLAMVLAVLIVFASQFAFSIKQSRRQLQTST